ncbi:DUF1957 domain-containing protein, partial [bacterium]|nr:DUF1957 domain-containing protein [bacterium]
MASDAGLGRFSFVLHSHLPYVLAHGRWPHGMVWLSEAAAETYIPLWRVFRKLADEGRRLAVTIGITPVLAEQLADPTFVLEFLEYLELKQKAARRDLEAFTTEGKDNMAKTAKFWIEFYEELEKDFRGPLKKDIIGAFRQLQDEGAIEIITCAATHGYLPLLGTDEAVNAQVKLGVDAYKKHFGRDPKGIWLPECAYRPSYQWSKPTDPNDPGFVREGVERVLQKNGLRYFVVDSHLLKGGKAIGVYMTRFEGLRQLWEQAEKGMKEKVRDEDFDKSPNRLYWVEGTVGDDEPVGILTRDEETSLQVWSGEWGYPGDSNYLDFHKKHFPGGHRYWSVTSPKADLGDKLEYEVDAVEGRLEENADHFVAKLREVLSNAENVPVDQRFVVSPFDTELFGHWWFEGPRWLEKVLRKLDEMDEIEPVHGSELIGSIDEAPVVSIPEGSWGEGGFHYIWLNRDTEWTWPLIYDAEQKMTEAAREFSGHSGLVYELLQQLARELVLLESSDWQFLISTVAARDYSEMRTRNHANEFEFVHQMLRKTAGGKEMTLEEWNRYQAVKE